MRLRMKKKKTGKNLQDTEKEQLELPEVFTEVLEVIKAFGDSEYQRGKNDMCNVFLKAVCEAIERRQEVYEEVQE